jgi:hypothetical protein
MRIRGSGASGWWTRAGLAAGALALIFGTIPAGAAVAEQTAASQDTSWQLAAVPSATVSGGQINSVSCSSAKACTAVGTYISTSGLNVTLAERWKGRGWRQQSAVNPAGDTTTSVDPVLAGVSCPAKDFCAAVGSYTPQFFQSSLTEVWNGKHWIAKSFPLPAGASSAQLSGVSCVTVKFCEAVGSYVDVDGSVVPLAATWTGNRWRLQTAPAPSGSAPLTDGLNAVSCLSLTFCEAGGGSESASSTFAERWSGKAWVRQMVPGTVAVQSVSCVTTKFCEGSGLGSAFRWTGKSWRTQTVPVAGAEYAAVSCVTAKLCEMVGDFRGTSGNLGAIAAQWTGKSWLAKSAANPATSTDTHLTAVDCTSTRSCEAGGNYQLVDTANDPKALAETWTGRSWRLQAAAAPAGATDNYLHAVSCVTASFCEAVGEHFDSSGNQVNLAEMWNGKSWTIQDIPSPLGPDTAPTDDDLGTVSCVSAQFCEAIGSGPSGGLAETWNGTSWAVQTYPGSNVSPVSVSCASASFCLSVNGFSQVDTWNGTSWSAGTSVTGISPAESVSCLSDSFCEVVGGGSNGEDAAEWNGSTWTLQTTAGPASTALNAVTCISATSCEAVGSAANSSFQEQNLAESWDGTTWVDQTTTDPATTFGNSLTAVSCTSASACTAVGQNFYNGADQSDTMAQVWDGTSWTLQTTPNPAGSTGNFFNGVSCAVTDACVAVGQAEDAGQVVEVLVENGP